MPTMPLREALRQAITELTAGRPADTVRRCDLLLVGHPRWLEAQRIKAEGLISLGRFPAAEQLLDTILAANPEHVGAYIDRAYLMQRRGDAIGSLACYRRACELTADNAQLRAQHNQLAAQLNRPPFTPSHTGLARQYLRAEHFAHAVREWDIALQANPNRLDAQIGIAETLWRMGDTQRSQDVCRYILRNMPFCLKPLLLLALFELDAGNTFEAQRLVRTASELDPEQAIAGELFADLVASGRDDVAQLFRDATRSVSRPLEASLPNQTGAPDALRLNNRPGTTPLPTGQLPTGPLFRGVPVTDPGPTTKFVRQMPPPGPTTTLSGGQQGVEDFFSQSRASLVPADFQQVFKETEYMLWSREHEDAPTAEMQATRVAASPPAAAPVSATPAVSPPTNLDAEPDSDAEMGFVRWLQAQGARSLPPGDAVPAPTPTPIGAIPAPQPNPAAPSTIAPPPFLVAAMQSASGAPPHDLRPVDEAPIMAPVDIPPPAPPPIAAAPEPVAVTVPVYEEQLSASQDPGEYPLPDPLAHVSLPSESGALTMEAIEHGLASAGFARLETGRLASLASTLDGAPPEAEAPMPDVAQRLEAARAMRLEGRAGEALGEYRALVKASAEHMPAIIRDLRDAAIEDPHEPEIPRLLGDALIRQGDYADALEAYNRANVLRQEHA